MASNSRGLVIILLTSFFFITGILFDYMPMIIDSQIKTTVELATNEQILSLWSKPPVDFHSYYWLYDILNVEQFLSGEKIQVRKVGPYHFTSRMEKRIIELSQNKYRLIYNSTRHFQLNDSATEEILDEPLRLLNPIYGSMTEGTRHTIRSQPLDASTKQQMYAGANRLMDRFNESLFINTTARIAILGRKVIFFDKARKMIETFGLDIKLPDALDSNLFGYLALLNGTLSGPFEIYTGYQASMPSLGDLISYKGKRRMTEYQGRCNRIQTSVGELRPMPIENNQVLEMYQPSLCRIVHLRPTGQRKMREGVVISYSVGKEDFLSADLNPDNRCFCINSETNSSSHLDDNYCSLNGAIELAPCSYYSPIVLTLSHIEPDSKITDSIGNFEPEMLRSDVDSLPAPDNQSQFLILKRIGVPIWGDITITLFMKVSRDASFRQTGSVPETSYIPLVMVRETASLPPKLAKIIVNLESFLALSHHLKVIMYLSAIVLLCWLTGHYYGRSSRDRVVPSMAPGSGPPNVGADFPPVSGANNELESERANSADSNRSCPPSRNSRVSLDEEAFSNAPPSARQSGASGAQQRANAAGATEGSPISRQQQGGEPRPNKGLVSGSEINAARLEGKSGVISNSSKGSKVFSKVDELRAATNARNQSDGLVQFETTNQVAATKNNSREDGMESSQAFDENKLNEAENDDDDDGNAAANEVGQVKRRNRNWFMKVCSNFVRMLNGIRTTISEASQLEISEHNKDSQDKQLELLAGKIDNWYSGSNEPATISASSLHAGEQNATANEPPILSNNSPSKPVLAENKTSASLVSAGEASSDAPVADIDGTKLNKMKESSKEIGQQRLLPNEKLSSPPDPGSTTATVDKGASDCLIEGQLMQTAATEKIETSQPSSEQPSKEEALNDKKSSATQSSRTIMNNKSDTSCDESVGFEDKASALEQIELALAKPNDTTQAPVLSQVREQQPKRPATTSTAVQTDEDEEFTSNSSSSNNETSAKPTMDLSDSIESVRNVSNENQRTIGPRMAANSNNVSQPNDNNTSNYNNNVQVKAAALGGERAERKTAKMTVGHLGLNQSTMLNDQAADQLSKLVANGVGDNDSIEVEQPMATTLGAQTITPSTKDERRDSGYAINRGLQIATKSY